MKKIILRLHSPYRPMYILSIAIGLFFYSPTLLAQKNKLAEAEFNVLGVCNMCKNRIESTAYDLPGVKWVQWDKTTGQFKVKYKPSKIKEEDIHVAVANAGHSTDLKKADPKAYQELPDCCKYHENDVH